MGGRHLSNVVVDVRQGSSEVRYGVGFGVRALRATATTNRHVGLSVDLGGYVLTKLTLGGVRSFAEL